MSKYSEAPSLHDLAVSLAVLRVKKLDKDAQIIAQDGLTPFIDQVCSVPKVIAGYRPDAIMISPSGSWLVEAKTPGDAHTAHSRRQIDVAIGLLDNVPSLRLFVLFAGVSELGNIRLPSYLKRAQGHQRAVVQISALCLPRESYAE